MSRTPEPFQRLVNQGIILGEDGQKMSKRRGNVVDPDRRDRRVRRGRISLLRNVHGAARADEAVEHERRRRRVAFSRPRLAPDHGGEPGRRMGTLRRGAGRRAETSRSSKSCTPRSRKSTEDIETLSFNTAISQMMIFVNALHQRAEPSPSPRCARFSDSAQSIRAASHFGAVGNAGREISRLRPARSPSNPGPSYDERLLVEDEVEIVLQVNGKVRDKITVPLDATDAELEAAALANRRVQEFIAGQDDSQGGRRPQKACQHRRDLRMNPNYVQGIQRIRGQRERRSIWLSASSSARPSGDRHFAGERYPHAADRLC